jgi:RNA polymerase sigma-70 factor, ECF subfamily
MRHRDRLRRKVELRMHARLQGRVDVSDVHQDGFLDMARQAGEREGGREGR